MATAASITTDWTTCPICLDVFDNPKSLPCIHGFCLQCLERYFKDNCPGDKVPCPLCRKEFKIPPDGLVGLQHHFIIQQLVDARNVSSKSTDEVPCEACLKDENEGKGGDIPAATVYCVDCNEKLCEKCSRHHRRPKMNSGPHQVRPLGAELEQEMIQLRASSCDEHKDEKLTLYCRECDKNICLKCSAGKHKQHDSAEIADVAETFKPTIDDDDKQVLSNINAVRLQSELMKQAVLTFQGTLARLEKNIKEAGEATMRIVAEKIKKQVNDCLEELQSVKADNAKQAETTQEQLQLVLMPMESFHTYSRELLDKGRPSDITRAASELHKRATELLADDVTSVQYWPPNVTFIPADVTQLTRSQLFGEVSTFRSEDKTGGQVVHTLPEGKPVHGVTVLDSLLYVLRGLKSREQIEVYEADSYRLGQCLTVPGLNWKSDMKACAHNRCLYVSGSKDKCVHRVGLLPDAVECTQWPVGDDAGKLSLTDTHSILVMCHEVLKIKEFKTDGTLLRQMQLPQDLVSPECATYLPNGQFVVSHGKGNDLTHRVCVVGSDGHLVTSYGGPKGSGSQQLRHPVHLAVDDNGFVFVADQRNRRVLLLSPALTYVREVASRDQLKWGPMRLSLNVDRRLLYIADCEWKDGKYTAGRLAVVSV